jgi:hypothetical protein
MRQPRRWAVALTVLLMAASLVFAPREGSAGPAGGRTIMPGDPRPTPELGGPETPPGTSAPSVVRKVLLSSVFLAKGLQFDWVRLIGVQKSMPVTRNVRSARRPPANQ